MNQTEQWERYKKHLRAYPDLGLMVDISRMNFPEDCFEKMEPFIQKAFRDMEALESGTFANPDENRMVGHYWLRDPDLAPNSDIRRAIKDTIQSVKDFAGKIRSGKMKTPLGRPFSRFLLIGIGGSALGPQLISHALGNPNEPMRPFFFDNTDPDGMDLVLGEIGDHLSETLTLVISKSGKTIETRNGMLEAKAAYEAGGLSFGKHAVAITEAGSDLDHIAKKDQWLSRFPMWDWVGGRTSVTSAVGLLPAALQGIDIDSFLEGARLCDEITRRKEARSNPAALLSLMWYHGTEGQGRKDMIILPYKDRLQLFPKYLQQLVMESLGKEKDLDGRVVHQGISVYGNKGSTDQHAYIQQLREGINNFFVTFIEILGDREGPSLQMDPDVTSGDYLSGFLQGTRKALSEKGRESITLTLDQLNARSLGALVALYERAVGLYASLIHVNAYHQPGVEAGKKAAESVIQLQAAVLAYLRKRKGKFFTAEEVALAIGAKEERETVFKLLEHAAANPDHQIHKSPHQLPFRATYQYVPGKKRD